MKAMILAAGFGTRLMPYTATTPKPLFTIAGRAALDWMIERLVNAGSTAIVVNTHHLNTAIENFIEYQEWGIPVETRYEPEILGTGGALKNVKTFWDDQPFVVVNSDIFTDIDINTVYRFHKRHSHPVTLALCSDPEFNGVSLNEDGTIIDFAATETRKTTWTFTGLHIIDPVVLNHIPSGCFSNIIDIYRELMRQGERIQTYIPRHILWDDLGTPERYARVARRETAKKTLEQMYPGTDTGHVHITRLAGDGSDRRWFRINCQHRSMVMVDHGIRQPDQLNEVDAYVQIGHHLGKKGVPLPEIYFADIFSGLVCLQDLGNRHLQQFVLKAGSEKTVIDIYKKVIRNMCHMGVDGMRGFNPDWAWQTPTYDRELILENECRYFVESFLNLYVGLGIPYGDFADEFDFLARETVSKAIEGFMHRDFQSRNIMLMDNTPYFIDFQGGRIGPVQYDLASLLIDPYVALSQGAQNSLLAYYTDELSCHMRFDVEKFRKGYACCAITRNLQILGAFGFLSKNRGKTHFETYIPDALNTLRTNLQRFFPGNALPKLKKTIESAALKSYGVPVQSKIKRP